MCITCVKLYLTNLVKTENRVGIYIAIIFLFVFCISCDELNSGFYNRCKLKGIVKLLKRTSLIFRSVVISHILFSNSDYNMEQIAMHSV